MKSRPKWSRRATNEMSEAASNRIGHRPAIVREVRLRKSIDVLSLISLMNQVRSASVEAGISVVVADAAAPGPRTVSAGPDYDPAAAITASANDTSRT